MYETTLANLERAYERLRMVDPKGETANKTEKDFKNKVEKDFKKPVEDLNLSVRAINCLHAEQIYTLEDLLRVSFIDLRKIPNCGKMTAREIRDEVERIGYKLLYTPNA
jgi:DNA-directed RNA polymerase subunit alpha